MSLIIQRLAAEFPAQWNRDFFGANREFNQGIKEIADLNSDVSRASLQASTNFFITRTSQPISLEAACTPRPDKSTGLSHDSRCHYPDEVFDRHNRSLFVS